MSFQKIYTTFTNGDISTGWSTFGGAGDHSNRIDEFIALADDTTGIVTSTNGAADKFELDLEGLSDFIQDAAMQNTAMNITFRVRNTAKWSDDTHTVTFNVRKADDTLLGTTAANITSTSFSNITGGTGFFTVTAAEVPGMRLEVVFNITVVGMGDGASTEISAVECAFQYSARRVNVA